jgi:hypothetical protein
VLLRGNGAPMQRFLQKPTEDFAIWHHGQHTVLTEELLLTGRAFTVDFGAFMAVVKKNGLKSISHLKNMVELLPSPPPSPSPPCTAAAHLPPPLAPAERLLADLPLLAGRRPPPLPRRRHRREGHD